MRHRNQIQFAVVDAEDLIALKIDPVDITLNLLIAGSVTKTQVTVLRIQ